MIAGKDGSDAVALRNSSTQKMADTQYQKYHFYPLPARRSAGSVTTRLQGTGIEGGLHTERKRGVVGAVPERELVFVNNLSYITRLQPDVP